MGNRPGGGQHSGQAVPTISRRLLCPIVAHMERAPPQAPSNPVSEAITSPSGAWTPCRQAPSSQEYTGLSVPGHHIPNQSAHLSPSSTLLLPLPPAVPSSSPAASWQDTSPSLASTGLTLLERLQTVSSQLPALTSLPWAAWLLSPCP